MMLTVYQGSVLTTGNIAPEKKVFDSLKVTF